MGLLHSLANTSVRSSLPSSSPLAKLISEAVPLNPIQRAELLTKSKELESAHTTAASSGQSVTPSAEDPIDLHFTCFVRDPEAKQLVELDGRRKGPVNRGVSLPTQEDLLEGACKWVQDNYVSRDRAASKHLQLTDDRRSPLIIRQMAMDPDAVQFNLIALGPAA